MPTPLSGVMGWDLVKPRYLCGFAGLFYVFNLGYTRFFSPTSKCTIIIHLTVILPPSQNPPRFVISCERPSVCQRGVIAATNAQLDIMNCKSASSSWPSFTNTHLLQQYLLGQSGAIPPEKKASCYYHLLWRKLLKSDWIKGWSALA